jgi:predicted DCC family thiol-disulfide oxidoreductase YuxK
VSAPPPTTIVFYDGVCGLCNRLNQFLLRRDRDALIRFAALQSPIAGQLLAAHGLDPLDLDTVYVMADWTTDSERVLARSRAVLHALSQLGGPWPALARLGSLVPRPLADLVYRAVARSRYRIFGKYDRCQIPPPEWRKRFLDQ